jgi:hypothetical protein
MTETTKKTSSKKAEDGYTPDLSTPFASAMKMWQGEMDRFFGEAEKSFDKSLTVQRKLLDEHARFAEAQLTATQDAMRVFTDGMQRIAKAGSEV